MKNQKLLSLIPAIFIIAVMAFLACEEKCNCVYPEEHIPDYHLIYTPSREDMTDGRYWTLIYSTKTGEIIDSSVSDLLIQDLRFTSDGTMAAVRAWGNAVQDEEKYIYTLDYTTRDTLALRGGFPGWNVFFSPDEQEILLCNGRSLAIFAFPSLDSIYVEYIANSGGGFLTSGDSIFYFLAGVDTLYVVDYSDRHNIVKTLQPIKAVNLPVYPAAAAVDYQKERIILYSNYSETWTSHIKVLNSNNLTEIHVLDINKQYNNGEDLPVIRPGSDELYLFNYFYPTIGYDYIDVYYSESNIWTTFMKDEDITTQVHFKPKLIDFTPDGSIMYVLLGGGPSFNSPFLCIKMPERRIIKMITPEYALGSLIRINPIDY